MNTRRALLSTAAIALAASSFAIPAQAQDGEPVRVVATFSILGDMVTRIGGEHVSLQTLVGPDGDTHVYQPTPADAVAVSEAELLVVNGLEFEGWLDRLVDASEFAGARVVAAAAVEPIAYDEDGHDDDHDEHGDEHAHDEHGDEHAHDEHGDEHDHDEHGDDHAHDEHGDEHDHDEHGDEHDHDEHAGEEGGHHDHHHGAFDPHAWQSLDNAVAYVDAIAAGLATADPANAATFYENRAAYVAEFEALDEEIHAMIEALPEDRRTVVTSHDAFQYFGRDYGLTFLAPQGLSTESEASAQDVAQLIERMREQNIGAVFLENIADSRLLERIAEETGAGVGGTLYPGALSGPDGPAPTYLDMMRHNAATLAEALGS